MNPGKYQCAYDGEDRHRLGKSIDGRSPTLSEDEEDCADQRARMTDSDPPDEVRDVPGPVDWGSVAPDPDAPPKQIAHTDNEHADERAARSPKHTHHPRGAGFSVTLATSFGDVAETCSRTNEMIPRRWPLSAHSTPSRHLRIRVADLSEIRRSRPCSELSEESEPPVDLRERR